MAPDTRRDCKTDGTEYNIYLQKLQGSLTCEEVERQWEKGRVCKRLSCIEVSKKLQGNSRE